jgi:hypothetical protein
LPNRYGGKGDGKAQQKMCAKKICIFDAERNGVDSITGELIDREPFAPLKEGEIMMWKENWEMEMEEEGEGGGEEEGGGGGEGAGAAGAGMEDGPSDQADSLNLPVMSAAKWRPMAWSPPDTKETNSVAVTDSTSTSPLPSWT